VKKLHFHLVCGDREQDHVLALLQRLGFVVEVFPNIDAALGAHGRTTPDLLLIDGAMLAGAAQKALDGLARLAKGGCPLVVLGDEAPSTLPFDSDQLPTRVELDSLQQLLRRRVESYSRQHPRVDTNLPGLYASGNNSQFCEILNLSAGGAYIKLGSPLAQGLEEVKLFIPLLGMKKELELLSEVVFQTKPSEENNYQQGAGIRFRIEDVETARQLEDYLALSTSDHLPTAYYLPITPGVHEEASSQKRGRRSSTEH
jgi:hypothetical protein